MHRFNACQHGGHLAIHDKLGADSIWPSQESYFGTLGRRKVRTPNKADALWRSTRTRPVLKPSTRFRYVGSKPGTLTLDHQYPMNRHPNPGTEASTMRSYLVAQDYIGVFKFVAPEYVGDFGGKDVKGAIGAAASGIKCRVVIIAV